jgi:hypothetical protein
MNRDKLNESKAALWLTGLFAIAMVVDAAASATGACARGDTDDAVFCFAFVGSHTTSMPSKQNHRPTSCRLRSKTILPQGVGLASPRSPAGLLHASRQ